MMNAFQHIQNLKQLVQTGQIGGMMGMAIMGKLSEIEAMLNQPTMGGMQPFAANQPMHNQNFYYPQQPQQMPNLMAQMQQLMPQQPVMPEPAPMQAAPQPTPVAPQPATVAPAPAQTAEPPVTVASGGGANPSPAPAVFTMLPGAGGGDDGKPAAGRDYLLSLLNQK